MTLHFDHAKPPANFKRLLLLVLPLAVTFALWTSLQQISAADVPDAPPKTWVDPSASYRQATYQAPDADLLSTYVDHQNQITPIPYYYLLDLARRNPLDQIEAKATTASYAQLLDQSANRRGEVLRVRGRLHRLGRFDATPNAQKITSIHEGWLFSQLSGKNPYAVVLADPPTDIPEGPSLFIPVEGVGYFLGWWRYRTPEGKRVSAPLVMLASLKRLDEPKLTGTSPLSLTNGFLLGGVTLALLLAGFAWGEWRRKQSTALTPNPNGEDWEVQKTQAPPNDAT